MTVAQRGGQVRGCYSEYRWGGGGGGMTMDTGHAMLPVSSAESLLINIIPK